MKKFSSGIALWTVLLFQTGCVPLRYAEYTGNDLISSFKTWPVGTGTMADKTFAVPVYHGWPERHYKVLGSIQHADPNAVWDEGDFAAVAKEAKRRGGDAVIIRQGAEFGVSKIADTQTDPGVLSAPGQTTGLVIKWLSEQEIQQTDELFEELFKRFVVDHPNTAPNRDTSWMVAVLLIQTGSNPKSVDFAKKYADVMQRLQNHSADSLAGEWIFKVSSTQSSLGVAHDGQNQLGIAHLTIDGENLAIVSKEGRMEINFSGTLSKGRLTGQIGVGSISARCEGAATSEKISISFQALTSDGTVRGNIVLQRLPTQLNPDEKPKSAGSGSRA